MTAIPANLLNHITTGDARELCKALPDESVALVFTDPVYDRIEDYEWLARESARILRPGGWCVAFCYTALLPDVMTAMGKSLQYKWQIIWHRNNEMKYRHAPTGKSIYVPAVVYSRSDLAKRHTFGFDLLSLPVFAESSNHQWSKPISLVRYYLNVFSAADDIVLDPFTGGGTVPAVCKMLGRQWVAMEIDPDTAERARQRVLLTQEPLFVLDTEQQLEMETTA